MGEEPKLPKGCRWIQVGKSRHIRNQYDQTVCQRCFEPINSQNTSTTKRHGDRVCGSCYLKWKAEERQRKGER